MKSSKSKKDNFWIVIVYCGIWLLGHAMSIGEVAVEQPTIILTGLPLSLMFGWLLLPENLAYNLTGSPASGLLGIIFFIPYWIAIVYLKLKFSRTRQWIFLLMLTVLILCSTYGCVDYFSKDANLMKG